MGLSYSTDPLVPIIMPTSYCLDYYDFIINLEIM